MSKRRELAKLAKAMFGDDPRWSREAERIETLVAAGNIEDADVALAHLALERLAGRRNGIDVALARGAMALARAYEQRGEREELERVARMFEHTDDWDRRAKAIIEALPRPAGPSS